MNTVSGQGKGHRKAPAQYQAKTKVVEEPIHTDPMNVWHGYSGTVEIAGMRFRVMKKNVSDDYEIKAIYVLDAPPETALYGLAGSSMYLSIGQVHAQKLVPNFSEGSPLRTRQQRMWDFFHGLFVGLGVKKVLMSHPQKDGSLTTKCTSSVENFLMKTLGAYSFEAVSPRAVFELKVDSRVHKGTNRKEDVLNVEVVSVDVGHPLHGYVRVGTRLFYDILARPDPDFKGDWAGDRQKVWEFLTDTLTAHNVCKVTYSGKA